MDEILQPVTTSFNRSLSIEHRSDRLTGDPGAVVLREILERSGILEWMIRHPCGVSRHCFPAKGNFHLVMDCHHLLSLPCRGMSLIYQPSTKGALIAEVG